MRALLLIGIWLVGCASTKVGNQSNVYNGPKPFLSKILFYDRTPDQRFILRFEPKIPQYELWNDERSKITEIKWKTDSKGSFDKFYSFRRQRAGLRTIRVIVDGEKGTGLARIQHDGINSFVMTAETKTDLLLKHNLSPKKPVQSLASTTPFERGPASTLNTGQLTGSALGAAAQVLGDRSLRMTASEETTPQDVKLVSLKVTASPLDKVLRALAVDANRNLIMGTAINGTTSASIQNMPYEKALELLLRSTPYRAEHLGATTVIRSEASDKTLKVYRTRYLDVSLMLPAIEKIASKDAQIVTDPNTNSFLINDKFQSHKNLDELFTLMDRPQRQVEVEAAILEVDSRNNLQIGFDLNQANYIAGPNSEVTGEIRSSGLAPVSTTGSGFFVGLTWKSVQGILTALQNKNKLNLLARPRVIALSDQEATMLLGSRIGYKTQVVTNGVVTEQIQFLTVGTQLKIKPHITMNNDILMYIKPEVSDGSIDANTKAPVENTTSTETKVLSHNGQTIVIGGLLRDKVEKVTNRVPVVGDLPIIGGLFGGTTNDETKNEVMILLSPNVIFNDGQRPNDDLLRRTYRNFKDEANVDIIPSRILPEDETGLNSTLNTSSRK